MNGDENKIVEPKIETPTPPIEIKAGADIISRKDQIEIWIKVITLAFTVIAVVITYLTYQASQKWKIAEFMSSKISEYSQNKSVKIVNQFLDYNTSRLEVDSSKYVVVNFASYPVSDRQFKLLFSRSLQCLNHSSQPCGSLMIRVTNPCIRRFHPLWFLFKRTIFDIRGTHIK